MTTACPTCHRPFEHTRDTDPSTSNDAGEAVTRREGPSLATVRPQSHRHRLLDAYHRAGEATDREAATMAGLPVNSCWWKRCSDLRHGNLIEPTGQTWLDPISGQARMICQLTEEGRAMLDSLPPLNGQVSLEFGA